MECKQAFWTKRAENSEFRPPLQETVVTQENTGTPGHSSKPVDSSCSVTFDRCWHFVIERDELDYITDIFKTPITP